MARRKAKSVHQMTQRNINRALGIKPLTTPINESVLEGIKIATRLNEFEIYKCDKEWRLAAESYRTPNIAAGSKRSDMVKIRNNLFNYFVRDIKLVRQDLDNAWGVAVRNRDGNICIRCGSTDQLSAHHWCVNAMRSRIARWDPNNGVCLCSGCHIGLAHRNPDWILYDSFREHIQRLRSDAFTREYIQRVTPILSGGYYTLDITVPIKEQSRISVTESYTRKLWVDWGLHLKGDNDE